MARIGQSCGNGTTEHVCQSDGQWDPPYENQCNSPPLKGRLCSKEGTTVCSNGTKRILVCDAGQWKEKRGLSCTSRNNTVATRKKDRCRISDLNSKIRADITTSIDPTRRNSFRINRGVKLRCANKGYKLARPTKATCREDGKWYTGKQKQWKIPPCVARREKH